MKILYIIDTLKIGGKERQLTLLIKELYLQHEIYILTFDEVIEFALPDSESVKIKILQCKKKKSLNAIFNIIKFCKVFSPQIIHTWDLMSTALVIPAKLFLNFKLINGSIRGSANYPWYSKYRLLSFLCFMFSDLVISNSNAGLISRKYDNRKKFVVVRNGFDPSRFDNPSDKEKIRALHNIQTTYIVGMVSTFRDGKDYETFFKGARLVLSLRNDVTFIAIGDGPTFVDIYNSFSHRNIKFLGKQSDIDSVINVFDIGVLLSITNGKHGEGISNSIMEYMAAGKPVIASNNGGNPEIVKNEDSGFLIPESSPEILAERINFLIDNLALREEMGKRNKRIISEQFSVRLMTDKYIGLYNLQI